MFDEKMEGALPSGNVENSDEFTHNPIHPAAAGAVLSEEKAVEELARAMCPYSKGSICRECSDECFYKDYAKRAVCAGWHKQSEGEWIVKGECWKTLQCSSCGHTTDTIYDNSPYCPNCGAKMKGGE